MAVTNGTRIPAHTNNAGKLSTYGNARRLISRRFRFTLLFTESDTYRFAKVRYTTINLKAPLKLGDGPQGRLKPWDSVTKPSCRTNLNPHLLTDR